MRFITYQIETSFKNNIHTKQQCFWKKCTRRNGSGIYRWHKKNKPIIIVEDESTIQNIIKSNIDISKYEELKIQNILMYRH